MKNEQDVPVVIVNERGLITFVNEAFVSVFGWSAKEITGRGLHLIIPADMRDAHYLEFSLFMVTGKSRIFNQPLKLRTVDNKGKEFEAEHFIVAENVDGKWQVGARIRPQEQRDGRGS